jgi:hypothetical protein
MYWVRTLVTPWWFGFSSVSDNIHKESDNQELDVV